MKTLPLLTPTKRRLLKALTVMRIAQPCSKKRTAEVSHQYGYDLKVDSLYKLMDKIDDDVIADIKERINHYTKATLRQHKQPLEVVFYDLTTIYFEANEKDELRQFGYSKDGKSQHVQITLALLVSPEGLPIGYELFAGNMYEGHTLTKILDVLSTTYKIKQVVVVADSGLLNKDNISLLQQKDYRYIIAARIKNMKKHYCNALLDSTDYQAITDDLSAKVIDYTDNNLLVCCYSHKKARKDRHERSEKLEKLLKKHGKSLKTLLPAKHDKPYVKIDSKAQVVIDQERADAEAAYDGHYALITNMKPNKDEIEPLEVISQYKGLWQIERSFRMMKSNISIRPVYHWTVKRMKAHFALCYLSFALVRYAQFKLKAKGNSLSAATINDALDTVKVTKITDKNGQKFTFLQDMSQEAITLYKTIRVKLPSKFTAT